MTIPASSIVSIQPGVIGTGGNPLALNAVMLTTNVSVPIGSVLPFPDPDSVSNYFGPGTLETILANNYFRGFDDSTTKPGTLYFAQYPTANVGAYLRSGSLAALTLTQLQALSGSLTVLIDGATKTAASIDLSSASSFSNAATIIATALSATVTYNSQLAAFKISSGTTGVSSTIGFATGTLAAGIKLTQATGAVTSQGAVTGVPGNAMDAVKAVTQNWGTFMTTFEPILADKLAFAVWTDAQNSRYAYVEWDSDANAIAANNTQSFGYIVNLLGYNACCPIYGANAVNVAAFVCGTAGSIDFDAANGRITFAFRKQSGLAFDVTDATIAQNLIANGYNFYGSYATANEQFNFFRPGQVSGEWEWMDAYVNQIYLNSQFQLALLTLLITAKNVPYNNFGYGMILQSMQDPINQALNFGSIQPNIDLSDQQIAEVNREAGLPIDQFLSTRGWYAQVLPATAQVRGVRGTPPCNFWYTDGGSVQSINLASIDVQ